VFKLNKNFKNVSLRKKDYETLSYLAHESNKTKSAILSEILEALLEVVSVDKWKRCNFYVSTEGDSVIIKVMGIKNPVSEGHETSEEEFKKHLKSEVD
jgi:hypothetical protein